MPIFEIARPNHSSGDKDLFDRSIIHLLLVPKSATAATRVAVEMHTNATPRDLTSRVRAIKTTNKKLEIWFKVLPMPIKTASLPGDVDPGWVT